MTKKYKVSIDGGVICISKIVQNTEYMLAMLRLFTDKYYLCSCWQPMDEMDVQHVYKVLLLLNLLKNSKKLIEIVSVINNMKL